ncbi:MAG TPA: NADH-quinone oxidoreductase subunit J [Gammaproteobacteria bacterium]|nr:NADH-quinone oxidoreductase subunit J [Gammaproteobacteria bacterium]
MIVNVLFMFFSALLLGAGLMVITVQNPVKSALFLVLAFIAATGLWLLLTAEFLALILVLVYVGAVMTLFLFVVMTLNIDPASLRQPYLKFYIPLGLLFTALLGGLLIYALGHTQSPFIIYAQSMNPASTSNVTQLGTQLYTEYALPFEMTGVLLLIAIIAAISLSLFQPFSSKHQSIDAQINVRKADRLRTVK